MDEQRRRDDAIDRELSRAFRAQRGTAAHGPHLDAEGAAAWFERRLDPAVSSSYEAHLAACPDCQALVATLARITPDAEPAGTGWWSRLRLPWLVPAAATAAAAIVIWAVLPQRAQAPQLESTQARTEAPVEPREPTRQFAAAEPESTAAPETRNDQNATPTARGNTAPAAAPPSLARERRDAATVAAPAPPPPPSSDAPPPGAAGAAAADARATAAPPLADAQAARKAVAGEPRRARPAGRAPGTGRGRRAATRAERDRRAVGGARAGTLNVVAADGRGRWRRSGAIVEFAPGPTAPFAAAVLPVGADALAAGSSPGGSVSWFVGAAGAVLVTTDGVRFVRVTAPAVVDLVSVVATDARSAVVTSADGRRFRTTDQGATWTPQEPGRSGGSGQVFDKRFSYPAHLTYLTHPTARNPSGSVLPPEAARWQPWNRRLLMNARLWLAVPALALVVGVAQHRAPQTLAAAAAPQNTSTLDDQNELALTVYNSDLALVRDVRTLQLPRGTFNLEFMDIAATVNPATVHFRSLTEPSRVNVLEQNYEYDLLEPDKLLRKYVGRDVTLVRSRVSGGVTREEAVTARLLSYNTAPVWQINGEIVTGLQADHIRFPELPGNLFARPTLIWSLRNDGAERHRVEAAYLATRLSWNADYVLTVARDDAAADIDGWVTVTNGSGTQFRNAALQLVAGNVNRVRQALAKMADLQERRELAAAAPAMAQESFSDYHLYTLARKTSINNNQTKQVSMLGATGVPVRKRYVVDGQAFYYRNAQHPGSPLKDDVQVFYQFANEATAGLGMPLPAGVVRVYQADSRGGTQFVGEDRIGHTPKDETLNLKIGTAFDVVAERKQVDFEKIAVERLRAGVRGDAAQPQGAAGDRGGQRADWRHVAHAQLHPHAHEDRRLGRAVPGARGRRRERHAALPGAGDVLAGQVGQVGQVGRVGQKPTRRSDV